MQQRHSHNAIRVHRSGRRRPAVAGLVRRALALTVSGLMLFMAGTSAAHGQQTRLVDREYDIKAAFLLHFATLVEWPDSALPEDASTITIGILGNDPFGGSLDTIDSKQAGGRRITIRRYATLDEVDGCQILFISRSEQPRLQEVTDRLRGSAVLTVSDIPGFARNRGIVGFVIVGNKVRFEVNNRRAREQGLQISSRLLRVASVVSSGE